MYIYIYSVAKICLFKKPFCKLPKWFFVVSFFFLFCITVSYTCVYRSTGKQFLFDILALFQILSTAEKLMQVIFFYLYFYNEKSIYIHTHTHTHTHIYIYIYIYMYRTTWIVMAKLFNTGFEIREFELQFRYYVHFRSNTFKKGLKTLLFSQLWVYVCHFFSFTSIVLSLNNPRTFPCR